MEMAKVTSKGQITIPVSIRRRLDIKEGDKLLFIDNPDGVVMVNPDSLQGGQALKDAELELENRELSDAEIKSTQPKRAIPARPAASVAFTPDTTRNATLDSAPDIAPGLKVTEKPGTQATQVKGVDIGALLDEIRSIGSRI